MPIVKDALSFLLWIFWHLCRNSVDCICVDLNLGLLLCIIDLHVCFKLCIRTIDLHTCPFIYMSVLLIYIHVCFDLHGYTIDLHACLFLSTCQYHCSTYMSVLIYISILMIYMSVFSSYHVLCSFGCQLVGRGDKQRGREGLKNKGDLKKAHGNLVTKLKK